MLTQSGPEDKKLFRGLFIGDSLMNPRYTIGLRPEDTYAYLLEMFWREGNPGAYMRTLILPGTRIKQLYTSFQGHFLPHEGNARLDVSVVHLGVVDCAPRVLSPTMLFIVQRLPGPFPRMIQSFLHKHRARLLKMGWSFRYTSPQVFEETYTKIVQALSAQTARTYLINIVPGIESLYKHSPGLKESIIRFNEIIRGIAAKYENVWLIDVFDDFQAKPDLYLTDDLHISKSGHDYIFKQIRALELKTRQQ